MNILRIVLTTLFVFACALSLKAQQVATLPLEPRTKLETLEQRIGAVIIKGYSDIGSLEGRNGTLEVESHEFTDAATGRKEYGLRIIVRTTPRAERAETEESAYVDYDEIEPLLKGLDRIGKTDRSSTQLSNFEARYRTRGDFEVTLFNNPRESDTLAATCGYYSRSTVYFRITDLDKLKGLIIEGRNKIDAIKQK